MYPVSPGKEDGLFATRLFDPVLSWRLKPNGWLPARIGHINSLGFVGKEFEWKKALGATRILTIGDSVTYGLWACGPDRICGHNPYPSALELFLWTRTGRDSFEVVNAGTYGYSSLQGLRYYRTYLTSLDADIVTIMFGWNDHGILRGFEGRELRNPFLHALATGATHLASYRTLAGASALVLMGKDRAQPGRVAGYRPRVELDDFEYNLGELVQSIRAQGKHVLLVTEPYGPNAEPSRTGKVIQTWALNGLKDYETLIEIHARYNDRTRAVARRLGVPLVDADVEFSQRDRGRLFDPYDLVHPNEAGHALIAEMIYRRVVAEGWVREPNTQAENKS